MSTINWDKVANEFADHDHAIERRNATLMSIHREDVHYMEQMMKEVIKSLPRVLKEHLDKRRNEGRVDGGWLMIWTWTNSNQATMERDLGVANVLQHYFKEHKIETKTETGGDERTTGYELYVNLDQLKALAMEHAKKPRAEISGKAKK